MDFKKSFKAWKDGKDCADPIDAEIVQRDGKWVVTIDVCGTEYETSAYTERQYALWEARGFLEGMHLHLDGELNYIVEQMEKGREIKCLTDK